MEDKHDAAITAFQGTYVSITIVGRRQPGAALGKRSFVEEYIKQKVAVRVHEINQLSCIASSHPTTSSLCHIHP